MKIVSYKKFVDNYKSLTESQVLNALGRLEMRELIMLILSNEKSFRVIEKILKVIYENEEIKRRMF